MLGSFPFLPVSVPGCRLSRIQRRPPFKYWPVVSSHLPKSSPKNRQPQAHIIVIPHRSSSWLPQQCQQRTALSFSVLFPTGRLRKCPGTPLPSQSRRRRSRALSLIQQHQESPHEGLRDRSNCRKNPRVLARGRHSTTSEAEAISALTMASKLMAQHNLTKDLTKAEHSPRVALRKMSRLSEAKALCQSHTLKKRESRTSHLLPTSTAMNIFFDWKSYHEGNLRSHDYTFYSIAQNTAAAAMAFEMCHNLILDWSLSKVCVQRNTLVALVLRKA